MQKLVINIANVDREEKNRWSCTLVVYVVSKIGCQNKNDKNPKGGIH